MLRGDFAIAASPTTTTAWPRSSTGSMEGPGRGSTCRAPASRCPSPSRIRPTTSISFEVKAENIYGVQGDVVARKYRISKEEPVALMTSPSISKPVRGTVKLEGTASDANGIKEVTVSVDNRTSYDRPVGTGDLEHRPGHDYPLGRHPRRGGAARRRLRHRGLLRVDDHRRQHPAQGPAGPAARRRRGGRVHHGLRPRVRQPRGCLIADRDRARRRQRPPADRPGPRYGQNRATRRRHLLA